VKLQEGYLTEESGKWLGHYSRWATNHLTGKRRRIQRAFVIGPVESISKMDAKRALRVRIVQELNLKADNRVDVAWFIDKRWQPLREGEWRDSTRDTNLWILSHIKNRFGTVLLEKVDKVELQQFLNALAKDYSGSLVKHVRYYLKSIFTEAVEQDYILKSPARSLRLPILKKAPKPYLKIEEIKKLLEVATGRDRLLLRVLFTTALRPSELFALRWKAFQSEHWRLVIRESIYRGKIRPFTKTTDADSPKSLITVHLPPAIIQDLQEWRKTSVLDRKGKWVTWDKDEDFIFPDMSGGPWWKENYQQRILNPLAKAADIPKLNFQILRRTVATHLQKFGSPQDIMTIMRHTTPDTAQENYVQFLPESAIQAMDKLADTILVEDSKAAAASSSHD